MNIPNAKNKIESGSGAKNKVEQEQFHFPGGGEYLPQTILATSREAAEEEYLRTRVPVAGKVEPEDINNIKQ